MLCQLLGMWFMLSKPTLAYFFMAVMSIGMAVGAKGVDPGAYIVEYLVVIAAAIVVGVLGGFVLVRPVPHPTLRESVDTLWSAVVSMLETLRGNAGRPVVLTEAFTEFSAARDELRSEHAGDGAEPAQREQVEQFALACFDVVLLGTDRAVNGRGSISDLVEYAQDARFSSDGVDGASCGRDGELELVARAQLLGEELCASEGESGNDSQALRRRSSR